MVMANARISRIDNAYARAQNAAKLQDKQRALRKRVHIRRFIIMTICAVAIIVSGMVRLAHIHQEQNAANVQLQIANKQLHKVKNKKQALKVQVDQLQNETYLGKLVRAQYYVSKSGETIFTLPASANHIPGDDSLTK